MASYLRRSLKEKARERLGFTFDKYCDMEQESNSLAQFARSEAIGEHPLGFRSKSTESAPPDLEEHEKENTNPVDYFTRLTLQGTETQGTELGRVQTSTAAEKSREPGKRRSRHLTQPKGSLEYNVSGSETLASIAAKFDTTTSELKKLNKLMTQMIWPGQKLFVPDKEFIPSEHNSPQVSPTHSPIEDKTPSFCDIPMIKQSEPKKGPGLAKAVESTGSPPKESPRALSEDEAKRLDDECYERFIKIGVKYITDGQGVVGGVLLVTPNAVMFDPNVSDPLVVEQGANKYGLIAPMETIISVAMYEDLAAMKLKSAPQNGTGVKHAVYHGDNCPLAKEPETLTPDIISSTQPSRARTQSICSCGAEAGITGSPIPDTSTIVSSQTSQDEVSLQGMHSKGNNKCTMPIAEEEGEVTDTEALSTRTCSREGVSSAAIDRIYTHDHKIKSSNSEEAYVCERDTSLERSGQKKGISSSNSDIKVPTVKVEEFTTQQQQQKGISSISEPTAQKQPSDNQKAEVRPVKVVNIVDLSEKPELFRSLDELIPRPAAEYVDPPLYLCMKVGKLKKRSSKTCPIEAYSKEKLKPEYWFSIPKDRVDSLYAFFIQWSPQLYGVDDDIDIEERGFVAVDNVSSGEEEIEVIDDYFDDQITDIPDIPRRVSLSRRVSLTKGWEVISSSMCLGYLEEIPVVPDLLNESVILTDDHTTQLGQELPARAEGYSWKLLYSTLTDGFSLKTLYRATAKIESPALIAVSDTASQVFGAMVSCGPRMSDHFYGTGESYLFTFHKEFRIFRWSGLNNFFMKGNMESMSIGAGEGSFGLWLDSDLYHGRTQNCTTYNNDLLTDREDFVIKAIEVWTFV